MIADADCKFAPLNITFLSDVYNNMCLQCLLLGGWPE